MDSVTIWCVVTGAFILGGILGHRFLPPRIDMERERMLSDLLAEKARRQLRGEK